MTLVIFQLCRVLDVGGGKDEARYAHAHVASHASREALRAEREPHTSSPTTNVAQTALRRYDAQECQIKEH